MAWTLIPGTPNYMSGCGGFIAVYRGTVRGFGNYWVFRKGAPRTTRNVLSVGGLPNRV